MSLKFLFINFMMREQEENNEFMGKRLINRSKTFRD